MKRFIFCLLATTLLPVATHAQSDTLIVNQPEQVQVIRTDDTLSVSVIGEKDNPGFYYRKTVVTDKEQEERTTTSRNVRSGLGWDFSLIENSHSTPTLEVSVRGQLYAGWNIALGAPSGMKTKWFPTTEVGIDLLHFKFMPRTDKWWATLRMGFQFSRYVFKDCMMQTVPDGTFRIAPFPDGSSSQSASFITLGGTMTLMGHYRLGKKHSIGLGAVWRVLSDDNCSFKSKYTLSDGTPVIDMNELPQRRHQFAIQAEYMFDNQAGFYIRYTPMSILKKGIAPSFQQLTVGAQIRF